MFYKLPIQIQTVEGALLYKIAPVTPPTIDTSASKRQNIAQYFFLPKQANSTTPSNVQDMPSHLR